MGCVRWCLCFEAYVSPVSMLPAGNPKPLNETAFVVFLECFTMMFYNIPFVHECASTHFKHSNETQRKMRESCLRSVSCHYFTSAFEVSQLFSDFLWCMAHSTLNHSPNSWRQDNWKNKLVVSHLSK